MFYAILNRDHFFSLQLTVSSNKCVIGFDSKETCPHTRIGDYRISDIMLDKVFSNHEELSNYNVLQSVRYVYEHYSGLWLNKIKNIAQNVTDSSFIQLFSEMFFSLSIILPGKKWWSYTLYNAALFFFFF